MKKVTFKINGMHCVSCAMNIDMELEDKEGILECNTNYAKQKSEISFDEKKIKLEEIINVIKSLGYTCESAENSS